MVRHRTLLPAAAAIVLLLTIGGSAANGAIEPATELTLSDGRILRMIPLEEGCTDWLVDHTGAGAEVTALPPSYESCNQGIRPGARMTAPNGCTFNFVFQQGTTYYIGTAAHCVNSVGQRVSAANVGEFGTVVFRQFAGNMDFALIRVDAAQSSHVNPRMCTWGGPNGITPTNGLIATTPLLEYGWGVASQFTAQTRSRAHEEFLSSSAVLSWNGLGSGGDSGAPVIDANGRAIGIHTWGVTPIAGVVIESGPSMTSIMSTLQSSGFNVQLVNGGPGGL
jgi:hypothetical protein